MAVRIWMIGMFLFLAGCGEKRPHNDNADVPDGKHAVTLIVEFDDYAAPDRAIAAVCSELSVSKESLHPTAIRISDGTSRSWTVSVAVSDSISPAQAAWAVGKYKGVKCVHIQ